MPLASGDSSHQIAFHTSVRDSMRCVRACVCMCITQSSNFEMYETYVVRVSFHLSATTCSRLKRQTVSCAKQNPTKMVGEQQTQKHRLNSASRCSSLTFFSIIRYLGIS